MNEDLLALAKLRFEELLAFFGVNVDAKVEEDGNTIRLSADTSDGGRLIGHRGETLSAIQHLVNMMVRTKTTERIFVNIDIAGYKQARVDHLMEQARAQAEEVRESGQEKKLRPMNAAERRIVHMALQDFPDLETESVGEDPHRRVVIKKKSA
jgi:spoIIIJ-associated protein